MTSQTLKVPHSLDDESFRALALSTSFKNKQIKRKKMPKCRHTVSHSCRVPVQYKPPRKPNFPPTSFLLSSPPAPPPAPISLPTASLTPLWAGLSQPRLGPAPVVSGPSSPQSSEGPTRFHATPWAVPWQRFETFLFKWHLNKRGGVPLYFNQIPWDPVGSRVPVDSAHGVPSVFWFELLCSLSRKGERGGMHLA